MQMMREQPGAFGQMRSAHRDSGFTLIEMMIAISVLAIGMLGAMSLMLMGMQSNTASKTDTTATVLDQEVIELYSSLKTYPPPAGYINIYDCALTGSDIHEGDFTQPGVNSSLGAAVYTSSTAPTTSQIGDINWTSAVPTLATSTTPGYAMEYTTCSGDTYEVRWNMRDFSPAGTVDSQLVLLTVSARQKAAVVATSAGAKNTAILYAQPVTLRSLIER
jgi:type IV pilus assembly protein PilV